ncbi:NF-kappa-B inhibitor zeta-like, partial [Heptranchias perlo]|uniref:NF-kappa-B inhibitor zeta-like n=1 Tax=Heptranchias perlo TaxID=212740 RepID=UPI00355A17AD
PKEKPHQQNTRPTVRELLEQQRRCGGNSSAAASPKGPSHQTDRFNFSDTGDVAGPIYHPTYPSWHTDVSQSIISPESCCYGLPNEFTPSDHVSPFNTTSMYQSYGFAAPCSEPAAPYPHQHLPSFLAMRPGSGPSLFEAPQTDVQHWPLSGAGSGPACAQQEVQPTPYHNSTPTPQPIIPSQLEEARRTIQSMEISELLQRDGDGDTILHIYAVKGLREFVFAAAEQIRDLKGLEMREHKGKTPLLVAVTANQSAVVCDLIQLGADIQAADFKGQTAFHLTATYGYPSILQAVLLTGVTVNVETRNFEATR